MISHEQYRKAVLTDPHDATAAVLEHRNGCVACADYTRALLRFEARLQRALRLDVSQWRDAAIDGQPGVTDAAVREAVVVPFPGRRGRSVRAPRRGWLALAASVLLAVVIGGFWLTVPGYSLAADVVTHMAEEPQAWRSTDVAVSDGALGSVLNAAQCACAPAPAS